MNSISNKDTTGGTALAAGGNSPHTRRNLKAKRLQDIEARFEMYTKPRQINEELMSEIEANFYKYNRK